MKVGFVVLAGLLTAGAVATPSAQSGPPAASPAGQDTGPPAAGRANADRRDDGALSAAELVNMLDTYAIVQAQRELTLDDTQYAQFVTRLKRLQETRRRNQRARNQLLQDLRKLSGPQAPTPVDEAAVRERLRTLRDHDDRAAAELRKAYDSLDEVLDVRQQARFRVFEETIERRKLDLVVRARERAARGGGS